MYYFNEIFLFVKSNGMPIYAGNKPIHKEKIVLWMPTNWLIMAVILLFLPYTLIKKWRNKK